MIYDDFYSEFGSAVRNKDLSSANDALMKELGNILVRKREDFVHLLNESEVPAEADMTDAKLVDLFIKNVPYNRELMVGASLLVNIHNKQMGADGEYELSDEGVKTGYTVLRRYFDDEDHSNAGGILDAIGNIVQGGSQVATKAMEGNQKKKYGALDIATQQAQAKAAMAQQVLVQRQSQMEAKKKEQESKKKTTRILLITGGVVLGLGMIAGIIYAIRKR